MGRGDSAQLTRNDGADMTAQDDSLTNRLAPRSRRWILIAAICATVVAIGGIAAALVIGSLPDDSALASFETAQDELRDAEDERDGALDLRATEVDNALDTRAAAKALEAAVDSALLADPAKRDALSAAIGKLEKAAELTVAADGKATAPKLAKPTAVPVPTAPADPGQVDGAVDELHALTSELVAETTAIEAGTKLVADARKALAGSATALVASAQEKGSATPAPELASQETKDAYAAAVAALEKPAKDADLAGLISAYQSAWAAAVASHDAANDADEPPVSGGGITYVDGVPYIDGVLIVNKTYALPSWYGNGLTAETQAAFNSMQSQAAYFGLSLYISSGFRSYDTQVAVYGNYVATLGQAAADRTSARPGHSEHQSGLAFDLNTIDHAFASTPEGQFVRDNAHKFGLIIRYPEGKESITGYEWEPWHIRYVGTDLATTLFTSGQTIEEYFGLSSVYSG